MTSAEPQPSQGSCMHLLPGGVTPPPPISLKKKLWALNACA